MADANPSRTSVENADQSKSNKDAGKPRVQITQKDLNKGATSSDKPHEILDENERFRKTQLRDGTVKITRK
jgi:hypothetical protein